LLLVIGSLTLASCVATRGDVDPQLIPGTGGRDVLFAADLVRAHSPTVYEAILEVRPDFFDRHAAQAMHGFTDPVHVFVDDVDVGDIDALRTLPLGPVTCVRYVEPGDAEFRWAHGVSGAAILVTTAR
jgi:hypothetical protein